MPNDESGTLPEPPELPSHWNLPNSRHHLFGPFPRLLFQGLCLISVHRPSLDHHWKSKWDDDEWYKQTKKLVGQINNSNVASGLLLATTAVFLTTPPPMQSVLNYAATSSYVFVLFSFAHSLGGILVGTAVIAVCQSCDREWIRDVLSATRLRLCLMLLLMAWPSVSLFLSIVFLVASMLVALFVPNLVWLQTAVGLDLLLWLWTVPAFIFCTLPLQTPQSNQEV